MDILLQWNAFTGSGDWSFANNDLASGTGLSELESAVLVSLFTDRIASADFVPRDGTNDRRGWWADTYNASPIGSGLWQMFRSKKTSDTGPLLQARGFCREALQWLIDDGIAASVVVNTFWAERNVIGIQVIITEPQTKGAKTFNFAWAWQ